MAGVRISAVLQDVRKIESEALIVGFYEDVRPLKGLAGDLDWLLCGALSSLIITNKVRGSLGEVALLTSRGKVAVQKIFLLGLGRQGELSLSRMQSAAQTAAASALGTGITRAALAWFQPDGASAADAMPAFRQGLAEGAGGRSLDIALLAPDQNTIASLERTIQSLHS